jgi:hypothetical protein
MVVAFGVLVERRSRTTYRPTVAPTKSTHVDTFTGTTSSFCCTDSRRLAMVAAILTVIPPRSGHVTPPRTIGTRWSPGGDAV